MHYTLRYLIIIAIIFSTSCNRSNIHKIDPDDVQLEKINVKRYEQALFRINKSMLNTELEKLQPLFPMFLAGDMNDSLNLKRIKDYITDTLLIAVYNDCINEYPDLSEIEGELTEAFRYFKYYFPEKKLPDVYTYVSGFDYEYPIQYFDDHLMIALDMYLGADYLRYKKLGLANYILRRFSRDYIVRDCMFVMAQTQLDSKQESQSLLDMMFIEGKKLWVTKTMIPDIPETVLFDYTEQQMDWAKKGEATVWAFLIENEMLYTTEMQPVQKFIGDGPFTSYFGSDSPPRLGVYIGFRILDSYMNRNKNIAPQQLMSNQNAQEILNRSGYKPKM